MRRSKSAWVVQVIPVSGLLTKESAAQLEEWKRQSKEDKRGRAWDVLQSVLEVELGPSTNFNHLHPGCSCGCAQSKSEGDESKGELHLEVGREDRKNGLEWTTEVV